MSLINSTYEHALACAFYRISNRGLQIDEPALKVLSDEIQLEIKDLCTKISSAWNCHVFVGRANDNGSTGSVNINSTSGEKALLKKLKDLGYEVPKIRFKNEYKEISFKDSTNELALRRLFAETQDLSISNILRIRELNKIFTTYCKARLLDGIFYSGYNVAGTLTGRRGSRKHIMGYGNNAQNFPKHSELGKRFRRCIIPRIGKVFLSVDQVQAEDWPVSALANNTNALNELRTGVDRHTNLASYIFGIPVASRAKQEWKDSIERYLGKKTRHSNNYGMRGQTMSDNLAKEGHPIPKKVCDDLLLKVNNYDPSVQRVFHEYIREEISNTRLLRCPLGRERYFLGFRANDTNFELFNEAFSYIPQSTVGDNTGLAILYLDSRNDYIVQDGHDSILQEINEDEGEVVQAFRDVRQAFDRDITFHNGITINIPIEGEIGYSLDDLVTFKDSEFNEEGLLKAWKKAKELKEKRLQTNAASTQGALDISVSPIC